MSQALPLYRATMPLREVERLVGMPYVEGRFTCLHLAVWAQKALYGLEVGDDALRRLPVRGFRQAVLVEQWRARLADRVDKPESGDLVLFYDDASEWQWHIGTVFLELGETWVLHTHQGIGASVLERLEDAKRRLLRVEGYYRWKVAQR